MDSKIEKDLIISARAYIKDTFTDDFIRDARTYINGVYNPINGWEKQYRMVEDIIRRLYNELAEPIRQEQIIFIKKVIEYLKAVYWTLMITYVPSPMPPLPHEKDYVHQLISSKTIMNSIDNPIAKKYIPERFKEDHFRLVHKRLDEKLDWFASYVSPPNSYVDPSPTKKEVDINPRENPHLIRRNRGIVAAQYLSMRQFLTDAENREARAAEQEEEELRREEVERQQRNAYIIEQIRIMDEREEQMRIMNERNAVNGAMNAMLDRMEEEEEGGICVIF